MFNRPLTPLNSLDLHQSQERLLVKVGWYDSKHRPAIFCRRNRILITKRKNYYYETHF